MTLDEIKRSKPELRARMGEVFKSKDASLLLDAIDQDILDGVSRTVRPEHGEELSQAIARWHSYLAGRRDVMKTIRNIDKEAAIVAATEQKPFEHAIPPHLREAAQRDFVPIQIKASKSKS